MPADDLEENAPPAELEVEPAADLHVQPGPSPLLIRVSATSGAQLLCTRLASFEFIAEGILAAWVAFRSAPDVPIAVLVLPVLLSTARLSLHIMGNVQHCLPRIAPLFSLALALLHGCVALVWGLGLAVLGVATVLFLGCLSAANAMLLATELNGSEVMRIHHSGSLGATRHRRAHGSDQLADLSLEREMAAKARRWRQGDGAGKPAPDSRFESTCVICLEECEGGKNSVRLPCGHAFHADCLHEWLLVARARPKCPTCSWQPSNPPGKAQVRAAIHSAPAIFKLLGATHIPEQAPRQAVSI